jgi:Predicted esterase of the alpha/beta hydrolase fold|nr:MAG: putative esterase [Candidatus Nanosalinarum sp. J07AB56]
MKSEIQVVFIDGGMTFRDRKDYLDFLENREITVEDEETWNEGSYLEDSLETEVVKVEMPCRDNARYDEWEITFEKYIPLLSDQVILVGLSLGGTFLAKYLSENSFPKELVSAYLIGTPYDDDLIGEELAGGFNVDPDLSGLEQNCGNLTLMFSEDDDVVPVRHADKYRQKLSDAEIITYESKEGHFQVAKFPELVEKIYKEVEKQ